MMTCNKCSRAITEQERAKKDGRPVCKPCWNAYRREKYKEDPEAMRLRLKPYTDKARQRVNDAKNVPCADCGIKYPPYVMDFDHRKGETKLFNIATGWKRKAEVVLAEIAKCDVVCANCHRQRTFKDSKERRW